MDQNFWNNVYKSKSENDLSWFQEVPAKSLELIDSLALASGDGIIDIGGGDSHLVDYLLARGFRNIAVLDISPVALEKAKARLDENAALVKFIASDVRKFQPPEKFKLWHDRATFHFLTSAADIESYLDTANRALNTDGYLIVSTFSKTGPEKCSGLNVSRYSDADLKKLFEKHFDNVRCIEDMHSTPWGAAQNFVYCGFKKK